MENKWRHYWLIILFKLRFINYFNRTDHELFALWEMPLKELALLVFLQFLFLVWPQFSNLLDWDGGSYSSGKGPTINVTDMKYLTLTFISVGNW